MGLDMYLTKKTYIGADYEHRKVTGTVEITVDGKILPIKFNRISEISEKVGYWRKANQIHKWFVDNIQGGKDDCGEYEVGYDKLKQLFNECEKAIKNKDLAPDLLPNQSGFFFGSTDYDEYYFKQLQNTMYIIRPLLDEAKVYGGRKYFPETIVYRSSW